VEEVFTKGSRKKVQHNENGSFIEPPKD